MMEDYIAAKAETEAKTIDGYMRLYVKDKPSYLPMFVYKWMMKTLLEVRHFRKPDGSVLK